VGLFSLELDNDEELEEVIRGHWISFLKLLAAIFLTLVLMVLLWMFLLSKYSWGWIPIAMVIFLVLIYVVIQWVVLRARCLVITSKRIIDVDQESFFQRTIAETGFSKIKKVGFLKEGGLNSLFKLGSLCIETDAGGGGIIVFKKVKYPDEVVELINAVMNESSSRVLLENDTEEEEVEVKKVIVTNE
jgi:membrane protein YdbS with pleckstrin-like domain